jgi:hypothetical protein
MADDDVVSDDAELDVFCSRQDDAWRTYLRPGWQPRYLQQHFDDEGEAFPAHLDFDDLERHMREHQATFERHETKPGGVRLTARGQSAEALASWLAGIFGTTLRARPKDQG